MGGRSTEYPEVDGLLLDRMEQSFYTFDDAFVDLGQHAENAASKHGIDFESVNSAVESARSRFANLTNDDLDAVTGPNDIPILFAGKGMRDENLQQGLTEAMRLRSMITTHLLSRIHTAANEVRSGVELIPITFPPPLSVLTGVDFEQYSKHANAVMIKFFTMHWPLIVTYWKEGILALNPSFDPGKVVRAVSTALEMEDAPSNDPADYKYPDPEDPHRAGTDAQINKIKTATNQAKSMPILPSVHGYGPLEDVERRWRIGWNTGSSGMWVNRYGYLNEAKLNLLRQVTSS